MHHLINGERKIRKVSPNCQLEFELSETNIVVVSFVLSKEFLIEISIFLKCFFLCVSIESK